MNKEKKICGQYFLLFKLSQEESERSKKGSESNEEEEGHDGSYIKARL